MLLVVGEFYTEGTKRLFIFDISYTEIRQTISLETNGSFFLY